MPGLQFRLGKIDETKNYLLKKIDHNYLMKEKYKKTCKYLNYVEHLLILASTNTSCVLISSFTSLVCVSVGITSSAVETKIYTLTEGIKKYRLFIKEKRRSTIK